MEVLKENKYLHCCETCKSILAVNPEDIKYVSLPSKLGDYIHYHNKPTIKCPVCGKQQELYRYQL